MPLFHLKRETKFVPEEAAQFKFKFLHKIVNVGFEGKGVINQDTKIFIDMNHFYDISLKSGHCVDSLRYFLRV
jgi:hypothetical protein